MPLPSVPAKITLSNRCPFPTLFFHSLVAKFSYSHNDSFHKLMKSELFGFPYNPGPTTTAEGGDLHICKIYRDVLPNEWILPTKNL